MMNRNIFDELFVLELANNHLGKLERGLKIISDFPKVVRYNNVRAAIKVQLRDVENLGQRDVRAGTDIRSIKKTIDTQLWREEFMIMSEHIRKRGCLRMATPF